MHSYGNSGLWKKGENYGGRLTLGVEGPRPWQGPACTPLKGCAQPLGLEGEEGMVVLHAETQGSTLPSSELFEGCLRQAALSLSPNSESSVQISRGILSLHDSILFCVISVRSLSQERWSWVRSPSKSCLR